MAKEIINLNGRTYVLYYQNLGQRKMALDEFYNGVPVNRIGEGSERRSHFSAMQSTDEIRERRFNFMADGVVETGTKFNMM